MNLNSGDIDFELASTGSSMFDLLRRVPEDTSAAFDAGVRAAAAVTGAGTLQSILVVVPERQMLVAEMLVACLSPVLTIPVLAATAWELPAFAGSATAVIVRHETGDEPECAEIVGQAAARGCRVAMIASRPPAGFAASRLAWIDIGGWLGLDPSGTHPAFFAALGLIGALLGDSGAAILDTGADVIHLMERQRAAYAPDVPHDHNPTRALADALRGQSVIFLHGTRLARVAAQFASSRIVKFAGLTAWPRSLPAAAVDWADRPTGCGILLRESGDEPGYLPDRVDLATDLFYGPVHELTMDGPTALTRLWSTLTLIDWAAFYLAP